MEKIIKYFFYFFIFVLLLFFLPIFINFSGIDNYHKSFLLFIFAPLLFFISVFRRCEGKLKIGILDFLVLIFLFFSFISAFFGLDSFSSFFGGYAYFGTPLITLFSLVFFYFLVKGFTERDDLRRILKILISSFGVIVVFLVFILYGVSETLVKYLEFSQGTFEDIAMLIAIFDVLLLTILVLGKKENIFYKYPQSFLVKALLFISFLFLMFINFLPAWWCFLFGLILISIVDLGDFLNIKNISGFKKYKNFHILFNHRTLILFFTIISFIFIAFNYYSHGTNLTTEKVVRKLQLDVGNSFDLSRDVRGKELFLGAGQENFKYVFSKLRSAEINNSFFWHLRFNRPASYVIDVFISTGILGLFSYFLIFIVWGFFAIRFLKNKKGDLFLFFVSGILFLVLFLGQFIYSANINLLFLFWLFFAINVQQLQVSNHKHGILFFIKKHQIGILRIDYFKIFIFIAVFVWFVLFGYVLKYYIADVYAHSGKEDGIKKAIILNSNRYQYYSDLSKLYLSRALEMLAVGGADGMEGAGRYFQSSILYAGRALEIAPFFVAPYETMAIIYRQIGEYSSDYKSLSADMFKKASEFEPTNPIIFMELGKLLMNTDPREAVVVLERAYELKKDHFQIRFNLAKSYINTEKEKDALILLDGLLSEREDVDVYYELGRANYNMEEYQKAIDNFNQVISLSPIHANALYSLGLSYEQLGQTGEALYFFKKVEHLVPENEDIKNKIIELENSYK